MARLSRHALAIIGLSVCLGRPAVADPVTEWNAIMEATIESIDPVIQLRTAAITQVAVFEAVNSIIGDYEPYLRKLDAHEGASAEAAAVAAAHRALTVLHPEKQQELDRRYAESLNALPAGTETDSGIQVGIQAADLILAARAHDGVDDQVMYTPGNRPGDWQPTPPDFTPAYAVSLRDAEPFVIRCASQFRLNPPPGIHTGRYARDLNEVKDVGSANSTQRPEDKTAVARFYEAADAIPIYFPAARQVSDQQGKTLSENARTFALLGIALWDAVVASFDSKYHYNFWRPVTAIRAAALDENPKTAEDPEWLSLVFTPPFPSYPSGHATFGGAARRVLEDEYGKDGHSITLSVPSLPDIVLHYASFKEIIEDIDDGRVFGGCHFRFDQEAGGRLGRRVGNHILRHALRPTHSDDCD